MGYSDAVALGGIRFTLGRDTEEADVDWAAMVLKQVLERLMPVSRIRFQPERVLSLEF
jgi:cysteine desulfurase